MATLSGAHTKKLQSKHRPQQKHLEKKKYD